MRTRPSVAEATVYLVALALLSTACIQFKPVGVDLVQLRTSGVNGVRVDFASSPYKELGRVRATERSWLFANCDEVGQRAIEKLAAQASQRGGNLVSELRFRGRWRWMQEPVCRQNSALGLLIVPLFLPVPVSVSVSGYAGVAPVADVPLQERGSD